MSIMKKARTLLIATVAASAAVTFPSAAGAAVVHDGNIGGPTPDVLVSDLGTPGQANRIKVTVDRGWITVEDVNPLSETSNYCWVHNPTVVVCHTPEDFRMTVDAGLGNDSVDLVNLTPLAPRKLFAHGGSGTDTIRGSAGNDIISGGAGADQLYGNDGNDTLNAFDGTADLVSGGNGCDSAELDTSDQRSGLERFNYPSAGYGGAIAC